MRPATAKCTRCDFDGLTWTEARQSHAHLVGNGMTVEAARALSPLCRKCAMVLMPRKRPQHTPYDLDAALAMSKQQGYQRPKRPMRRRFRGQGR
jgi:hypothetical protein